jgi:hypothetical protein
VIMSWLRGGAVRRPWATDVVQVRFCDVITSLPADRGVTEDKSVTADMRLKMDQPRIMAIG